jgi:hypothetical protein
MLQTLPNWQFWLAWFFAFLGFPIGGLLAQALAGAINNPISALWGGLLTGAVIGLLQWLVLRQQFPISSVWILATALGMAVGLGLSQILLGIQTQGFSLLERGLITGLLLGLAQAVVLYMGLNVPIWQSLIWVAIVGLGWSLGWFVTRSVGIDLSPHWTVFGSTGAWVFQLLTGLVIYWHLASTLGTQGVK